MTLDLQGLLRSGLMAKLSGARRIVGLGDAREGARWFYDTAVPVVPGEHAVLRYLRTLAALDIPAPSEPAFRLPPGRPPATLPETPYILLHPFARGAGKSLPEDLVAKLCAALAPAQVVVAGMGTLTTPLPPNTLSLLNQTSLPELIWLIRHAAGVISVDSGPMHIAAAVDTPLLSIHTWSDPRLVGPFNEDSWIWQGGQIRPQQLEGAAALLPATEPAAHDIPRIAAWARERLEPSRRADAT